MIMRWIVLHWTKASVSCITTMQINVEYPATTIVIQSAMLHQICANATVTSNPISLEASMAVII